MSGLGDRLKRLWGRYGADLGLVLLLAYVLALALATANEIVELSQPFRLGP